MFAASRAPHVTFLSLFTLCIAAAPPAHAQLFLEPGVDVLTTLTSENAFDSFGFVAETIGDIDKDGRPDYIVGAPGFPASTTFNGKIYVYSGATGTLLNAIEGNTGDALGFSVAGIGDIDGDQVPDYASGGPFADGVQSFGRLIMVSGASHEIIHDINSVPGSLFGYDINAAGDVNNDSVPDVIVGALTGGAGAQGQVSVISGLDGSVIWARDGEEAGDNFGSGVSGLGADISGDGIPDQVVGAFAAGPTNTGLGFLISGADGSVLHELPGLASAGSLGWFFAHAAGDVNADGVADAYVGDFSDFALGGADGRAYVFSGADGSQLQVYDAEFMNDGFGIGRGAGDVNTDGHADLFLAGFTNSSGAVQGGKGYLYSGRDQSLIRSFTGTVAGSQLGFDAIALGDVNGNGYTDFMLTGVDVVHVMAGADASPAARVDGVCELLSGLPDEAFLAPANARKQLLCAQLSAVNALLVDERFLAARARLINRIQRRMDGDAGGSADDDWLTDASLRALVLPWVQGLVTMTESLAADN